MYRGHVHDFVAQIRAIFDRWVTLREIEPDYAELANKAAVNRWELMRLVAQAERLLPQAVHGARDQELTWTQIGELLNTTAATAARRYRNKT